MTPLSLRARILVGPALRAQPDRRLVSLAREGHEPALEEVVRRYRPALLRYAGTIVPPDRADDVVQDSIARALPALSGGDSELHLRAWLYTIVRNTALNNLRDAGPEWDHLDESYDGVEQPPQALERRQNLAAMVAGVRTLPETQREALVKREMEGMSHSEIGAALGVSVGAARQLIHRGRLTLREGLGALIPMPVLRQLLEGLGGPAVAGTGAGGALAAKAIVALLAAGGALTAGVALHQHTRDSAKADPVVAERAAPTDSAPGSPFSASGAGIAGRADRQPDWSDQGAAQSGSKQTSLTSLGSTGATAGSTESGHPGGSEPGKDAPGSGSGHEGGSHHGDGSGELQGGEGGESGSGEHSGESSGGGGSGEGSGGSEHSGSGDSVTPEDSPKEPSGEGSSSGSGSPETEPPHPVGD